MPPGLAAALPARHDLDDQAGEELSAKVTVIRPDSCRVHLTLAREAKQSQGASMLGAALRPLTSLSHVPFGRDAKGRGLGEVCEIDGARSHLVQH